MRKRKTWSWQDLDSKPWSWQGLLNITPKPQETKAKIHNVYTMM